MNKRREKKRKKNNKNAYRRSCCWQVKIFSSKAVMLVIVSGSERNRDDSHVNKFTVACRRQKVEIFIRNSVKLSIMFCQQCKRCYILIEGYCCCCCWCTNDDVNKNRKNCACVERFFLTVAIRICLQVLISSGRHIFNYQPDLLLSWKKKSATAAAPVVATAQLAFNEADF